MSVVIKKVGAATPKKKAAKSRATTIVVNSQKRAVEPKKRDKKRRVKKNMKKVLMSTSPVFCPSYANIEAFEYPFLYRTDVACAPGNSIIAVFAPVNDFFGYVYTQAASPPNATTVPTSVGLSDTFLSSLLNPVSTSGATNAVAARFTEFCIEILTKDALSSVNNTVQLVRWTQGGVPLVSSGAAPEFSSTYNSIGEHPKLIEEPSAYFTGTKCLHTGMLDRSALEFTPVTLGGTYWNGVYGFTAGTSSIGQMMPWSPILMTMTTASTGTASNFKVIIKGKIQINAPPNNYLSRIQKPIPTGGVGAENRWWENQSLLKRSGLLSTSGPGRATSGYVGLKA